MRNAPASTGWANRGDGKAGVISWALEHTYEEVTVKEISDACEVSEATVRALIKERPDIFKKSEGWKYEIRDPKEDRNNERKN